MGISIGQIIAWIFGAIIAVVIAVFTSRVKGTKGKNIWFHLVFVGITIAIACALVFLPSDNVQKACFSPLGIAIVGTLIPCYKSVVAVASPDEEDDKALLQYWIVSSFIQYLQYCSPWMNNILDKLSPKINCTELWLGFEFFFFLWLFLPWTDGAVLIHKNIGDPYVRPILEPITKLLDSWISVLISASVNFIFLWVFFVGFTMLHGKHQQFVTVTVGVVYPFLCSVAAAHTEQVEDDTYWLTYWACYGLLFLAMQFIEQVVGRFPGMYIAVIAATMYLMLPMFQGADKVFRYVLVPLFRQHEMLFVRDAMRLEKEIAKKIPKSRVDSVRKQIASRFSNTLSNDPAVDAFLPNYQSISGNTDGMV